MGCGKRRQGLEAKQLEPKWLRSVGVVVSAAVVIVDMVAVVVAVAVAFVVVVVVIVVIAVAIVAVVFVFRWDGILEDDWCTSAR